MKKLVTTTLATLAILLGSLGLAAPAHAATTVRGEVACINSQVKGVWIQAESSRSGWASWSMPVKLGGLSKANYSFSLNKGGRYQVHVGCGGSTSNWDVNAKSGWTSGTRNNFRCNDIHPWLSAAAKRLIRVDLSQGIAYKTCKRV